MFRRHLRESGGLPERATAAVVFEARARGHDISHRCHPRECGGPRAAAVTRLDARVRGHDSSPVVTPAKVGVRRRRRLQSWMLACAGMTA